MKARVITLLIYVTNQSRALEKRILTYVIIKPFKSSTVNTLVMMY